MLRVNQYHPILENFLFLFYKINLAPRLSSIFQTSVNEYRRNISWITNWDALVSSDHLRVKSTWIFKKNHFAKGKTYFWPLKLFLQVLVWVWNFWGSWELPSFQIRHLESPAVFSKNVTQILKTRPWLKLR